jgi:hypothetical protein
MLEKEQHSLRSLSPAESGAPLTNTADQWIRHHPHDAAVSTAEHRKHAVEQGSSPAARRLFTHCKDNGKAQYSMHAAKLARKTQTDVYGRVMLVCTQ